MSEFERVSHEVVLIDGKYYRLMSDEECAKFIWGEETVDAVVVTNDPII